MKTLEHKKILFNLKVAAMIGVFGALIIGMGNLEKPWIIPLYLLIGYYFGKWTCGTHSKRYGLWLTLTLFILLNFLHSLFDGILSVNLHSHYENFAIYAHELIRQPALYVVIWGMLAPFGRVYNRIILSIVAVTGTWLVAWYTGAVAGQYLYQFVYLDSYLAATIFIFAGDIIHHLVDDYMSIHRDSLRA